MFESIKKVFTKDAVIEEELDLTKSYSLSNITSLSDVLSYIKPDSLASAEFDYSRNIKEGYLQNVIAYYCVELISNLATQPRVELYVNGDEVTSEAEAGDALAVYRFLQKPNDQQTLRDFVKNYIIHDYLAGETFMYRLPNNNAIRRGNGKFYLVEPNNVSLNETQYIVTKENGTSMVIPKLNGDKTRDILHRAHWHPTSDRGTSALTPAWLAIQNFNNALKWNASVLNNSARMSLIAVLKSSTATPGKNSVLSTDQMKDLQQDLAKFGTQKGRGKPFVISGDWDFKELGQNNKDLEFNTGLESMSRMIALAFGVDPVLLSLPGDSTYNNKKEATASLFKLVVLPKLNMIFDDITMWFKEIIGADFEIKINIDDIPALEEEREKLWDRQAKAADLLTINERRALLGYEPIEGGDVIQSTPEQVDLEFSVTNELISKRTAYDILKKSKAVPRNRSFEEEQNLINQETGMSRFEDLNEDS